jgi:glycosyltransferase involved in cell wall biosynthesis
MKISIIAGNSMGGTEKAAYLFACELARRGHHVDALTQNNVYHVEMLQTAGVRIIELDFTLKSLVSYIEQNQPDIIHNHTSGYADHSLLYNAVRSFGENKPRIVETNVFGQLLDFSDQGDVHMRMFVSFTSGMQAFVRMRKQESEINQKKYSVLFNPLPQNAFNIDKVVGRKFRASIGVTYDEILVIRLGRPGPKWEPWECKAFQRARKKNPRLKLFLMEPKKSIIEDIRIGKYGDGIIVNKASADQGILNAVYSAGDLMLQASSFGESYGYTLAEAMAVGMPIITLATPWADCAQTELVIHGKTGYVCQTTKGLELALHELSESPDKMKIFGKAAIDHIRSKSSLDQETDLLEEIFHFVIADQIGKLMKRRHVSWNEFINTRNSEADIHSYESDNNLHFLIYKSSLYHFYKSAKHFLKYLIYKMKGYKVLPNKRIN